MFDSVSRSRFSLVLLGITCFTAPARSQDNEPWSPYRQSGPTVEAQAKREAAQEIVWDAPVRIANFEEEDTNDPMELDESILERNEPPMPTPDEQQASFGFRPRGGSMMAYVEPVPRHQVIRAPGAEMDYQPRHHSRHQTGHHASLYTDHPTHQPTDHHGAQHFGEHVGEHGVQTSGHAFALSGDEHLPAPPIHGEHSKFAAKKWIHGPMQAPEPTLPGAKKAAVWKQPYSYGYFGGSSTRHWTKHHGYRDRTTEFRFR